MTVGESFHIQHGGPWGSTSAGKVGARGRVWSREPEKYWLMLSCINSQRHPLCSSAGQQSFQQTAEEGVDVCVPPDQKKKLDLLYKTSFCELHNHMTKHAKT